MHRIYKRNEYVIYKTDYGYIVQNILMDGFAHTHLESFKQAKYIVNMSVFKRIPHHLSKYMLISLLRVNKDDKYVRKIQELIDNKKPKQQYVNSRGFRNG